MASTSMKRMSCGSNVKTENREKERNAGLMVAWSHAQYAGEREREREHRKLYSKTLQSQYINLHVCVFNAHFYTSPYKD